MNDPPLTQESLSEVTCTVCGEDHGVITISQKCHEDVGTVVLYEKATGRLLLVCAEPDCRTVYAQVVVGHNVAAFN